VVAIAGRRWHILSNDVNTTMIHDQDSDGDDDESIGRRGSLWQTNNNYRVRRRVNADGGGGGGGGRDNLGEHRWL